MRERTDAHGQRPFGFKRAGGTRGDLVLGRRRREAGATPRRGGVSGTLRSRAAAHGSRPVRTLVRFGPESPAAGGGDGARVASGAMKVTLPDGTPLELPEGASGADAAAAIGPGLARAALAVKQNGQLRDLALPLERRRAAGGRHRSQRPGRAGSHPPRRRARARRRGDGALPGREDLDRAADRERLLLRLRLPRRGQPVRRGLRGDRGEDARAHRRRRAVHARGRAGGAGARALPRGGPGLQGRAHRGPGPRCRSGPPARDRLAVHQRPVHRPVPRPARAQHQAHRGVQAAVRGRRLLARRRQPPDAHARVRHGLLQAGRARRVPRAARAGAGARPPQARPRARAVHLLAAVAGLDLLAAEGHRGVQRARGAQPAHAAGARLRRGQDPAALRVAPVGDLGALGQVQGEHLRLGVRGARVRAEADELPGPLRPVRHAALVLPRPPGALRRARAAAPPRAQRHAARPHARAPLHPGRRPHLLHRGPDPGRGRADAGLRLRDLRHVRLPGARRALDASRRPSGRRRAVGSRRGGARQGARDQRHRIHDRRGRGRLLRARRSTCT